VKKSIEISRLIDEAVASDRKSHQTGEESSQAGGDEDDDSAFEEHSHDDVPPDPS
jgi:hypothetical protein